MPAVKIIKPGVLTTVQDLGRFGYRHLGVPVSGAVDQWALRTANSLVGNPQGAAVLEATLSGPAILFLRDSIIAVTGADMSPRISGRAVPMWQSFFCSAGDMLELGYRKNGCRCYLAFAGGIDVQPVLGSCSTFLAGGFGGFAGRPLRGGDLLNTGRCDLNKIEIGRTSLNSYYNGIPPLKVKVLPGINIDRFDEICYKNLLSTSFVISRTANRMGCHLEGNPLAGGMAPAAAESFPAVPGSIQILPTGLPVILLNDAQSTGGYPQLAAVIAADLWKIGQAVPGDRICFEETDLTSAESLYQKQCNQVTATAQKGDVSFYGKTNKNQYKVWIQYKD